MANDLIITGCHICKKSLIKHRLQVNVICDECQHKEVRNEL